jgi:hypothetical protein
VKADASQEEWMSSKVVSDTPVALHNKGYRQQYQQTFFPISMNFFNI